MATPKVKFRFCAPRDGGHSLLKIVAFDFQGVAIPIKERYTFNGRFAPESGKPSQYEKVTDVEKGVFRNFDVALSWAQKLWEDLPKHNVAHGFIADADYPAPGTKIWQPLQVATVAKPQNQPFIFRLRMKLKTGKYLELQSSGQINTSTAEVLEDWKTCLQDIQAQYTRWAAYNVEAAKTAGTGMVFGDGKKKYKDTHDLNLWRINFNPQTGEFTSRKSKSVLKIQDERRNAAAQAAEEMISNYTA